MSERDYRAVFGWETDAFGEITMWCVPGFVGGEPEQPVPRDVVDTPVSRTAVLSDPRGAGFSVSTVPGS